jgi:hypothetical protein
MPQRTSRRNSASAAGRVVFPSEGRGSSPTFEVTGVTFEDLPPNLIGRGIDTPTVGSKGDTHVLAIRGWVVSREGRAVDVDIVHQGAPLRSAPVVGRREDVEAEFPEAPTGVPCAFFLPLGLVGLEPISDLILRAVLDNGARVPFASIRVSRKAVHSGFKPTIQPIILTGLGRSGTTWLMKLLGSHPEILVYDHFPYEHATAKYWLHMFKVLSDPGNPFQSAKPHEFQNNLWWVGNNPFHDESVLRQKPAARWFGRRYVEHLAAFCQSSIEDFYSTIARSQRKPPAVYFAEKHNPNLLPTLTHELYPRAKELFLVRDFRDMACSVLAFDEKRGFSGFGFSGGSKQDYIRLGMRNMALEFMRSWRSRGSRSHLLRYEDLAMRPAASLTGMLDYLGVDSSPAAVDRMLRGVPESPSRRSEGRLDNRSDRWMAAEHRTSPDLMASIGRWRTDGGEALSEVWEEAFGDVLAEFGYL